MKILIFTQHFPPETVATGRRALDLAESLTKRGHQVTVITGVPNHPSSLVRPGCCAAPGVEVFATGYQVVRVPVFCSTDSRVLYRLLTYASFMLSAAWEGLWQGSADMVLAVSPLPTGLSAMLIHWVRRAPLVFDLQDIWPDSAMAVGVMRPSPALRLLRRVEHFFYRRCSLIVGITEGFRRYLLGLGISPDRVAVVHNGVDVKMFEGCNNSDEFSAAHLPGRKFVVGYVGNIGLAQGLETLLDAAATLVDRPVTFLLTGEGTDKARLQTLAQIRGLTNIKFLDGVPRERVPTILASCDALLLALRRDPLFEVTIPSKLYEYMAAGKPILCSVDGEAASLVATAQCGLPVAPSDGAALAAAIRKLSEDPPLCSAMGEMGRRCVRESFSRAQLMDEYAELIERVVFKAKLPVVWTVRSQGKTLSSKKS
jgi:colanic acid biosynthesis glycosyl transferase WcaI